jgi:hypothetical protein
MSIHDNTRNDVLGWTLGDKRAPKRAFEGVLARRLGRYSGAMALACSIIGCTEASISGMSEPAHSSPGVLSRTSSAPSTAPCDAPEKVDRPVQRSARIGMCTE